MNTVSLTKEADKSIEVFSEHLSLLRRRILQVEKIIQKSKSDFPNFKAENFDNLAKFLKLSSLITISHLDLIVANKYLHSSLLDWEKIFFHKSIYLTVYETLMTYKEYEKFLFDFIIERDCSLKENFDAVNNEIKDFKKKYSYSNRIEKIRNNIAGHISKDFDLYYSTIFKFNGEETAKMCIDFFKLIQNLQNFTTLLLGYEDSKLEEKNQNFLDVFEMLKEIGKNLNGKSKEDILNELSEINRKMEI